LRASRSLVLRSAEGASRRTARSEIVPAAILRDGASRLLQDEVCGLKLHPFDPIGFHGIDLQAVCLSGRLAKEMPWAARRVRWAKVLRRIGGLLGQAAKNRVVHVQALFSLRFPDWLRLRKLGSFAEISLSVGLVWLMRNRAAPMGSSANDDGSIRRVCLAKTPCALSRARSAEAAKHRVVHVKTLFSL
jgi:hypothetical protein